ncbi:hypothetical protein SDC9_60875 [bioreactor metagenome]|uniref:Uncharacterized protein n=1 Tax=bioreactor metagenome TaxID=1076179 RepID=A0A644XFH3_9ZZZZ
MDERLGVGHEHPLGLPHRPHHLHIGLELGDIGLVGGQDDVAAGVHQRFGEHQVLGDRAQVRVDAPGDRLGQFVAVHAEQAGAERDGADVRPHGSGSTLVLLTAAQCTAPDLVVGQVLHHDDVPIGVELVDRRHQVGHQRVVGDERLGLVPGPVRCHRPPLAGHPHPRQGLLDAQSATLPVLDQEDHVEIAVPDLIAADQMIDIDARGEMRLRPDVVPEGGFRQEFVVSLSHFCSNLLHIFGKSRTIRPASRGRCVAHPLARHRVGEQQSHEQHQPLGGVLVVVLEALHRQAGEHDLDEQRAEDGAPGVRLADAEHGGPHQRDGHRLQQARRPGVDVALADPADQNEAADGGEFGADHVREPAVETDPDAGQPGGLRIGTDGVHHPAPLRPAEEEPGGDGEDEHDDHRDRNRPDHAPVDLQESGGELAGGDRAVLEHHSAGDGLARHRDELRALDHEHHREGGQQVRDLAHDDEERVEQPHQQAGEEHDDHRGGPGHVVEHHRHRAHLHGESGLGPDGHVHSADDHRERHRQPEDRRRGRELQHREDRLAGGEGGLAGREVDEEGHGDGDEAVLDDAVAQPHGDGEVLVPGPVLVPRRSLAGRALRRRALPGDARPGPCAGPDGVRPGRVLLGDVLLGHILLGHCHATSDMLVMIESASAWEE